MGQSLKHAILLRPCFTRRCSSVFHTCSITQTSALRLIYDKKFILSYGVMKLQGLHIWHTQRPRPPLQHFSISIKTESVCQKGSTHTVLLRKLEAALKDHQVDEAWVAYNDFRNLYGFPNCSLISRLIIELSYSTNPHWLQRACDLVFLLLKEKSDFLLSDILIKLSLSLARAQMPVPTSMIFRLLLGKESLPQVNIMGLIFLHMVKTEIGTYIASNILTELCEHFQRSSARRSASAKLVKPVTIIFNLVLNACVKFGSSFKGQQIIELMAQVGVIADAHTIVIISRIHEMNGQRDELRKFKQHIDRVSVSLVHHYRQFYDSLLSLHFKFNDLDAASGLILDMYGFKESVHTFRKDPQKPFSVSIGSDNLRKGLKIQIFPELLQKDSVLKMETKEELVKYKNGKLILNNKGVVRLITRHKSCGRIDELSRLLFSIQKVVGSLEEETLCSDVVDAFINLGWLDTAHDVLDDMELAGSPLAASCYASLLRTYYKGKMFREAEVLIKQIEKAGLVVKTTNEALTFSEVENKTTLSSERNTSSRKLGLAEYFIREMEEEKKAVPSVVYVFNSSIYFFLKAKMVGDALKTYRKMQEMEIQPTVQTYINMVSGYSSLEMYREITILWGDIKSNMENANFVVKRDLYEFLILNFLRGGYFERVMEVIGYMKKHGMYVDKWILKIEFLKFHKDLYRSLKASNARSESQGNRIEHVREFRMWVGID